MLRSAIYLTSFPVDSGAALLTPQLLTASLEVSRQLNKTLKKRGMTASQYWSFVWKQRPRGSLVEPTGQEEAVKSLLVAVAAAAVLAYWSGNARSDVVLEAASAAPSSPSLIQIFD